MAIDPGSLAIGLTVIILLGFGLISAVLVAISRRRMARQERETEKGHVITKSVSVSQYPPQLPNFSTRSSLAMSSEPSSPKSPRSPGIRFIITAPSYRNRKSGSIDSLPCMEIVLEKYEQEEDAAGERTGDGEEDRMLSDSSLDESGPNVISDKE